MPLPTGGTDLDWPPADWHQIYGRYREHEAWFSGSPNKLAKVYFGSGTSSLGFWRTNFDVFWARSGAPQTRLMLHEPIAAAICSVSSDLLFAEPPDFTIKPEEAEAEAVQARLDELLEANSVVRSCSELAETVAAFGGGFLRVLWDKEFEPEHPFLMPVDADNGVPEFRWGRMTAVTFWRIVEATEKQTWRYLERHEPGYIYAGLYEGTDEKLGTKVPLGSIPEANLGSAEVIETKIDALTAVYIPNVRPNRVFRGIPLGRSDFDGVEAQLNALDEASTSLMRDLRLARARLIVPADLLEDKGRGQGARFDVDQEVWEGAPTGMPSFGNDKMITPSQFLIRADDHLKVVRAKLEAVLSSAGYSNATFGLEMPRNVPATATEIVNSERQSFLTRSKKISYWTPALQQILRTLLEIDSVHFKAHEVYEPRVEFADSVRDDPLQQASVVQVWRAAESASAEIRVRYLHPKWSDEQVDAEVASILEQFSKPSPQLSAPGATSASVEAPPPGADGPPGIPPRTMGENPPAAA